MSEYNLENEIVSVRSNDFSINPIIIERWSPRSLLTKPVNEEDLQAVLEAAHWAPSCFNEQPWRFIVVRKPEDLQRMQLCLAEKNRLWADRAPVLIAVLSNPVFSLDNRPNPWHAFDAGTAWGYLALEAKHRGLVAHGMGGFSAGKIRETFGVPEAWGVHCVVALGYQGPVTQLPDELRKMENPSMRRALNEVWAEGRFDF
jgi:nitroreductase